jgi:hypothetical protein
LANENVNIETNNSERTLKGAQRTGNKDAAYTTITDSSGNMQI